MMAVKPVALALVLTVASGILPGRLLARSQRQDSVGQRPATLRARELPVSLERIKRKLAQVPPSQEFLLRLDYYVEVHGRAPQLDIFEAFDLHAAPVPFGAPTHSEMIWHVTPEEFRPPVVPVLAPLDALIKWLTGVESK